jgi:hypothetical protein
MLAARIALLRQLAAGNHHCAAGSMIGRMSHHRLPECPAVCLCITHKQCGIEWQDQLPFMYEPQHAVVLHPGIAPN